MAPEKTISSRKELSQRIALLQQQLHDRECLIKDNYQQLKTNLKPINLLHETVDHFFETPKIKKGFIKAAIGFAVVYLSKRAAEKATQHYLNKWENKNPESWLSKGISFIRDVAPPDSPIYPFVRHKK